MYFHANYLKYIMVPRTSVFPCFDYAVGEHMCLIRDLETGNTLLDRASCLQEAISDITAENAQDVKPVRYSPRTAWPLDTISFNQSIFDT